MCDENKTNPTHVVTKAAVAAAVEPARSMLPAPDGPKPSVASPQIAKAVGGAVRRLSKEVMELPKAAAFDESSTMG